MKTRFDEMRPKAVMPKRGLLLLSLLASIILSPAQAAEEPLFISGVYPHLTTYDVAEDPAVRLNECGIGAIVPWAGKLWMVTYGAHNPYGSGHKLYSIGEGLQMTIHPESVGGTPAGRFIHRESNQLLIANYLIDGEGTIRTIQPKDMPGRVTAITRHLADPENKVYYVCMEGEIYEANVHSLEMKKLFHKPVPGWHAKGAYVAQNRLVVSNNGEHVASTFRDFISPEEAKAILQRIKAKTPEERGVLASWDGERWDVVERKQFTEVMGPGGLYGNFKDNDPIWAIGWDRSALRLKLLDEGRWHTFLLPKSSFNNDAIHGWYTEWPRIRSIGAGRWMMDMHGMFFDFPVDFSAANTAGIGPIGSHLRYIPDFCEWNGRLVLATDETSIQENPKAGQPQSNLWFGSIDDLKAWGPGSGYGGPWTEESVAANVPSLPFLVNGFKERILHLVVHDQADVTIGIEVDYEGTGEWTTYKELSVTGYQPYIFPETFQAQWIRLRPSRNCIASANFHQSDANYRAAEEGHELFAGLADIGEKVVSGSVLYALRASRDLAVTALGEERETLAFSKEDFAFVPGKALSPQIEEHLDMAPKFTVDAASVIVESHGERLRLPKGDAAYDQPFSFGWPRGFREVQSERELANIHGTFYELPLVENKLPPLFQKLRPVSSHRKQIADFASWNGLLVMTGVGVSNKSDTHVYRSEDGGEALWFGGIDDLWKLGKPVGKGGPWHDTHVRDGEPSDPYLMTGYDRKTLILRADKAANITVEVNFDHNGYHAYRSFALSVGQATEFVFPKGFSAHWVRLRSDRDCTVSATFIYE